MTEGVAKIEDFAQAGFALILRHHLGLDFTGALDHPGQSLGLPGQYRWQVLFNGIEVGCIANHAVLDHLGQSGTVFTRLQSVERIGIDQHRTRLMKSTDHVLAQWVVDSRFTTDRRIHLR